MKPFNKKQNRTKNTNRKKNSKNTEINTPYSIITLNINTLKSLVKNMG